jgi:hypothetical protein
MDRLEWLEGIEEKIWRRKKGTEKRHILCP